MVNHIDLRFRCLEVKRLGENAVGPVNVHNNSTIKTVSKAEGKLSIEFSFACVFEPNIGTIRIEGEVYVHDSEENIERAMKEWSKEAAGGNRNLPPDVAEKVHNAIISSCVVESVILSKEVGLPAPIPTPTISLAKKDEKGPKTSQETSHYIR